MSNWGPHSTSALSIRCTSHGSNPSPPLTILHVSSPKSPTHTSSATSDSTYLNTSPHNSPRGTLSALYLNLPCTTTSEITILPPTTKFSNHSTTNLIPSTNFQPQFPTITKTLKMAKICELCESPATTYCDSDQASLCWSCDYKVHSINFLVARHSRNLLCHICQSITAWSGSGSEICPAISLCVKCSDKDSYVGSDELEELKDDEEEEDGECQVVPWSSAIPPPCSPASSCSSFDDDVADEDEDETCSDIFVSGNFQPLDLSSGDNSGRRCKRDR